MSGDVEVFLDAMPGETRGIILRDGLCEHLLIQRDDDPAMYRLGACSVGRVTQVEPGLRAAFVDLGGPAPFTFLPMRKSDILSVGQKVEVRVTAEPRAGKGASLALIGPGEGEPRLLQAGSDVSAGLARLAPGVEIQTGLAAVRASIEAEEEALSATFAIRDAGLDLAVERTRALVAVDIDWTGAGGQKARGRANALGLIHAARLIRLKAWGGLVAVDLVGVGHEANEIARLSRAAFGTDPAVVHGPVNRFGVLSLSLPWGRTPIDQVLAPTVLSRTLGVVRRLRHNMLSDTTVPRFVARCVAEEAEMARSWVASLGPRAAVVIDQRARPGQALIEKD